MDKHIYKRKPRNCPVCSSGNIANILYGMPTGSPELENDLEYKKVILGGCIVSPDKPYLELYRLLGTSVPKECTAPVRITPD